MVVPYLLVGLAAICLGLTMLIWPRRFWHETHGRWWYDNPNDVQLSEAYLLWNAVQALSVMILGLTMILAAWLRPHG